MGTITADKIILEVDKCEIRSPLTHLHLSSFDIIWPMPRLFPQRLFYWQVALFCSQLQLLQSRTVPGQVMLFRCLLPLPYYEEAVTAETSDKACRSIRYLMKTIHLFDNTSQSNAVERQVTMFTLMT